MPLKNLGNIERRPIECYFFEATESPRIVPDNEFSLTSIIENINKVK